jgi:hypothetical protein
MQAVVIAVITTLIGIIFAVLVSRHYYKVSIKHRLSVYSTSSPGIFYEGRALRPARQITVVPPSATSSIPFT